MSNKPLQHSPGPWRIELSTFPDGVIYVLSGKGKPFHNNKCLAIAEVWTDEHDAKLIAAAPEMYQFIRELRAGFYNFPYLTKREAKRILDRIDY